jgi:hypothetical protein
MKVGYLVGEFPRLSETFVIDEVLGHVRSGIEVVVISLHRPTIERALPKKGLSVLYVFGRAGGRLRSILAKFLFALPMLLTNLRLWRVVLGPGFGGPRERLNILGLARALAAHPN